MHLTANSLTLENVKEVIFSSVTLEIFDFGFWPKRFDTEEWCIMNADEYENNDVG